MYIYNARCYRYARKAGEGSIKIGLEATGDADSSIWTSVGTRLVNAGIEMAGEKHPTR